MKWVKHAAAMSIWLSQLAWNLEANQFSSYLRCSRFSVLSVVHTQRVKHFVYPRQSASLSPVSRIGSNLRSVISFLIMLVYPFEGRKWRSFLAYTLRTIVKLSGYNHWPITFLSTPRITSQLAISHSVCSFRRCSDDLFCCEVLVALTTTGLSIARSSLYAG